MDYKIKRSATGLGLFAAKDYKKGEPIIEYKGKRLSDNQFSAIKGNPLYMFDFRKNVTIDGSKRSNTARYVNHACKPNSEAIRHYKANKLVFHALVPIKSGEEITIDYGKEYFDWNIRKTGCKCANCLIKQQKRHV